MSKTKPNTQLPLPAAMRIAADFIEANPERYRYYTIYVPKTDSGCGCMAGWTFFFQRKHLGSPIAVNLSDWKSIDEVSKWQRLGFSNLDVQYVPAKAARYLRLRADELETLSHA